MEIEINSDDEYEFLEVEIRDDSKFKDPENEENTVDEHISSTSSNDELDAVSLWAELPSLALESIYSFLNRKDQSQMSLVCKNWSEEYGAPNVWRIVKFVLYGHDYSTVEYPEIRRAQKYGNMFRHVEISCRCVHLPLQEIISQQLKRFLQALTYHSQLSTLVFLNMDMYFRCLDEIAFEDIYLCILSLLLVQNNLTSIEFQNSAFKTHEASEMFRIICNKHGGTLKSLNLKGFIRESRHDLTINIVDARPYYETLMSLQIMIVDYSQMFENIVKACFDYAVSLDLGQRRGTLEQLKIFCNGSKRVSYQGIPSEAWKYFRKIFPALKIDFIFHAGRVRSSIDLYLVRHMPVRSLNFILSQQGDEEVENEIGSLLRHVALCKTSDLLEDLSIMWPHRSTNLAGDLIMLLSVCLKLKVMQLHIEHPVHELDTVFQWWLENGPKSLEEVQITISNVTTSEDTANYVNAADEYAPLLQVLGLNLILIVDSE